MANEKIFLIANANEAQRWKIRKRPITFVD